MNKTLRFLLVLLVLAGIIIAAGSKAVWATPAAKLTGAAAPQINVQPAAAGPVGSVQAPNCAGVTVADTEEKSVCGVVLVTGTAIGTNVFAALNGMPNGFLSQAVTLYFKSGSAQICFAAPEGGTIFFQAPKAADWVIVPTDVIQGFACATVAGNGDYALGATPAQ